MLGIVSLQLLLPVILLLSVVVVKQVQKTELASCKAGDSHLGLITIADTQAERDYKAGEEIMYDGLLYDIGEVHHDNGVYALTVLADSSETKLAKINSQLMGQHETTNNEEIKILPFFFLYHEQPTAWEQQVITYRQVFSNYIQQSFTDHSPDIIAPPPRLAA